MSANSRTGITIRADERMNVFGLAIALGVIFAAGWGLARLLASNEHAWNAWELAGLSWVFGTGYVSIAIWLLGQILSSTMLVAAIGFGAAILAELGRRIRRRTGGSRERWGMADALLLALLFAEQRSSRRGRRGSRSAGMG